MIKARPGAICDSCFLECHATRCGRGWRFPCDDGLRLASEERRVLDAYETRSALAAEDAVSLALGLVPPSADGGKIDPVVEG